jgi:hypothetical protein
MASQGRGSHAQSHAEDCSVQAPIPDRDDKFGIFDRERTRKVDGVCATQRMIIGTSTRLGRGSRPAARVDRGADSAVVLPSGRRCGRGFGFAIDLEG